MTLWLNERWQRTVLNGEFADRERIWDSPRFSTLATNIGTSRGRYFTFPPGRVGDENLSIEEKNEKRERWIRGKGKKRVKGKKFLKVCLEVGEKMKFLKGGRKENDFDVKYLPLL